MWDDVRVPVNPEPGEIYPITSPSLLSSPLSASTAWPWTSRMASFTMAPECCLKLYRFLDLFTKYSTFLTWMSFLGQHSLVREQEEHSSSSCSSHPYHYDSNFFRLRMSQTSNSGVLSSNIDVSQKVRSHPTTSRCLSHETRWWRDNQYVDTVSGISFRMMFPKIRPKISMSKIRA